MSHFRADQWFDKKVHMRTLTALLEKETQFADEYRDVPKDKLLDYVRYCAKQLGFSPNQVEIIGGTYIARQFGSWETAVHAAGLPRPHQEPRQTRQKVYKQEYLRQVRLFQQERKEAKEGKMARVEAQPRAKTGTEAQQP